MEKIIHVIWWQGVASAPDEIQPHPFQWGRLNPDHRIMLWDAQKITELVYRHYRNWFGAFDSIGTGEASKVAVIKKCDFARLLILHHYGGVYVDLDCPPVKSLDSLFGQNLIRHRFTPFRYSRNFSTPTVLLKDNENTTEIDWGKYDLILSREHLPNREAGGYLAANTVMCARQQSPLLKLLASECLPNAANRVLDFAGPRAVSRVIRENPEKFRGRTFTLPPWYFLWQTHDMGEPWEHTVCCHLNRLDWADKTLADPWEV